LSFLAEGNQMRSNSCSSWRHSPVYKMIDRGEIKAIRIGKKTLHIPSSELERYLEREPAAEPEAASLEELPWLFERSVNHPALALAG
jgi:hypothetical protein